MYMIWISTYVHIYIYIFHYETIVLWNLIYMAGYCKSSENWKNSLYKVVGFFSNFEGFKHAEFKNISEKAWAVTVMQLSLAVTDHGNMVLSII